MFRSLNRVLRAPVRFSVALALASATDLSANAQFVQLKVHSVILENPAPAVDASRARQQVAAFNAARQRRATAGGGGESGAGPSPTDEIFDPSELAAYIAQLEAANRDLLRQVGQLTLGTEVKPIVDAETSSAYVTLAGDPDEGTHGIIQFLRTDLLDPATVSLERLYHPVVPLTAKWFDLVNLPRVAATAREIRVVIPGLKNTHHLLVPGVQVNIIMRTEDPGLRAATAESREIAVTRAAVSAAVEAGIKGTGGERTEGAQPPSQNNREPAAPAPTPPAAAAATGRNSISGELLAFDERDLFIRKDNSQNGPTVVPMTEVLAILVQPEEEPEQELTNLKGEFYYPNARSIRVEWKKPEPPNDEFLVTYRSTAAPWTIRYEINVYTPPPLPPQPTASPSDAEDDPPPYSAEIEANALIYNRTAYDWESVPVVLRQRTSSGTVEYALDRIKLGIHQAGSFPVVKAKEEGDWRVEMQRSFTFNPAPTDHHNGEGALPSLTVESMRGPLLVPSSISIFLDGALFAEENEVKLNKTFTGPKSKTVLVTYSPRSLADDGRISYQLGTFAKDRLLRTLPQTYTVTNAERQKVEVTILAPAPPTGWKRDMDELVVAVDAASEGEPKSGQGTIAFFETDATPTRLNPRVASSRELRRIRGGTELQMQKLEEIAKRRDAIEDARARQQLATQRLAVVEETYYKYAVIDSAENRAARDALKAEMTALQSAVAALTWRRDNLQTEIDRLVYQEMQLMPPPAGRMYHGVFAPVLDETVNEVTQAEMEDYEAAVGKKVAWVQMSYDRLSPPKTPRNTMAWIARNAKTPVVRLRLHKKLIEDAKPGTLQEILDGKFDDWLLAWGAELKAFAEPVVVVWGGECNGHWNSWSGVYNGGGVRNGFGSPDLADGPERFAAAYRHIVYLVRDRAAASNVTWMFHVNPRDNSHSTGNEDWNKLEAYYPGPNVVDWIGVSMYGAQDPNQTHVDLFRVQMDSVYGRLSLIAPEKKVIVAEFGSVKDHNSVKPEDWTREALTDLFAGRWPQVAGFMWWNERWTNKSGSVSDMRVQGNEKLAEVMKQLLEDNKAHVQESPLVEVNTGQKETGVEEGEVLPIANF